MLLVVTPTKNQNKNRILAALHFKMLRKIASLLLLFLVFVLAYILFRKDLTLTKAEVKARYTLPNSHFINWKDGELHYTESGNDSNMTVLMIHGFGGSNRDFYVLDSLINNHYHVIRIDLPGFGLSDFPFTYGKTTLHYAYAEYFSFILDTLHIDSCFVMGNSLGGLMSIELTAQHPDKVKRLVLFNSAGYDLKEVMKSANAHVFRYWPVKFFMKKGLPEFITKAGIIRVAYSNRLLTAEKIKRVNSFWNREGNLKHIVEMANSNEPFDVSKIRNIACPVLIVWGKQDKIINVKYAERFHQDIKGSRIIIYDSCGHVPMMEKPLKVQHDVIEFLSNTSRLN